MKFLLNEHLKKHGWSKRNFAKVSGVSRATIVRLSNDGAWPMPETLERICLTLKVTPNDLMRSETLGLNTPNGES